MNDVENKPCCSVLKEAWQKVCGVKSAYWGGLVILLIVTAGGLSIIATLVFSVGQATLFPHFWEAISTGNHQLLIGSEGANLHGLAGLFGVYHLLQLIFQMLVLLPMALGLLLIPLRRVANKTVEAAYVFSFFRWHYIWRFILLEALILIMVLVPAGFAVACFMAAIFYTTLPLAVSIVLYVLGGLFSLFTLYLAIAYTLARFALIDRDLRPWEAMELSRKSVNKRWFCVLGAVIYSIVVMVIGALCLLIGLIWAIPYVQNIFALLYKRLIGIEGQDPITMKEKKLLEESHAVKTVL